MPLTNLEALFQKQLLKTPNTSLAISTNGSGTTEHLHLPALPYHDPKRII
jgi:hypothetical protein